MAEDTRFLDPAKGSFFLFGPRGTGKTTWLRQRMPDALTIDLLDADTAREMAARPERLKELVLANPDRDVVVDEVQRVPDLLHVVHSMIESQKGRRFVLTGSSARKLRRGGVNLLGGRAALRNLHPFMAAELKDSFDLEESLTLGLVPLVVRADDPQDTLAAYAALYLEQEVKAEGIVRQVGDFARFLEVISFSHGSQLTLSNVARDAAVNRKTVEGFVEVLEDLLLAFRLPVFTRRARRATVVHPKFYYFDAGVYRSLRPAGPLDRPAEIDGAALEGLVAQHLRAWIAYTGGDHELFYWRTRSGVEVDFIVYGSTDFTAIEVKNGDRVRPADLRGLKSFMQDYPECRPLFLYRGAEKLVVDGIPCWPVSAFLRSLRPAERIVPAL